MQSQGRPETSLSETPLRWKNVFDVAASGVPGDRPSCFHARQRGYSPPAEADWSSLCGDEADKRIFPVTHPYKHEVSVPRSSKKQGQR